jgi:3-isopropylmalate/(R)-2-methylmalate dehydratase small subunit
MKRNIEGKVKRINGSIDQLFPQAMPLTARSENDDTQIERSVITRGDIIVASKITGCSNPAISEALKSAGVTCVIAPSFPRSFYRNCINLGVPLIECPELIDKISNVETITIDFDKGEIRCKKGNIAFPLFPEIISKILYSGGLIPQVKKALGK